MHVTSIARNTSDTRGVHVYTAYYSTFASPDGFVPESLAGIESQVSLGLSTMNGPLVGPTYGGHSGQPGGLSMVCKATESVTGVVVNQDSCGHNYPLTAPITITLPPQ